MTAETERLNLAANNLRKSLTELRQSGSYNDPGAFEEAQGSVVGALSAAVIIILEHLGADPITEEGIALRKNNTPTEPPK
ncbi:hypothetical protein H7J71_25135 [Mycolicibacterium peregrinum]|uniref:hypothetical protein n=1 Tax=Mycolicibacterium peregrinum TaxID=43304 RepID=UPI0006D7A98D|nr:hypothetical protein [Mycolicibacterium peregrinum]MCV7205293.1 hypothetical protein [Mycolicibacterium peregrinum]ORW54807.1 hypothetical protein AWC21_24000 [Mycolicibacterium peregrinum]